MNLPPPPAELAHLAEPLGAEKLFALIDAHGGTNLYIPRAPGEDMPIAKLLGLPAAQALASHWGGDTLRVPLARAWMARCLRARGYSHAMIARHLRTTENTVRLMLQPKPDTRQMGLPL
jgi:hypothetical protein